MRRIKLTLEYRGTSFHGFQRQDDVPSVQQHIEEALFEVTGQKITLQVAGRTDAGVHATGQVCHFDVEGNHKLIVFKDGINRFVPDDIRVTEVEEVTQEFQARFNCYARHYEYLLYNRRVASPFWMDRAAHIRTPLDVEKMQEAAKYLVGEHDFSAFRSPECTAKTAIKKMHQVDIHKEDDMLTFTICGNAFLHNMVRIMCGTLVSVGKGKLQPEDVKHILESKDRNKCPLTLPSCGLYFTGADYPEYEVLERC